MKYTVITAVSVAELIRPMNEHIGAGWRPQGGVAFGLAVHDRYLLQAMVRD
jgi:hypothetical protein